MTSSPSWATGPAAPGEGIVHRSHAYVIVHAMRVHSLTCCHILLWQGHGHALLGRGLRGGEARAHLAPAGRHRHGRVGRRARRRAAAGPSSPSTSVRSPTRTCRSGSARPPPSGEISPEASDSESGSDDEYGGRSRRTRLFGDQLERADTGSWQIADGSTVASSAAHRIAVGDFRVRFVVEL